MPVAIDTSVLIHAEKSGQFARTLPDDVGPFYIPAPAASEFLIGTHAPVKDEYARRALGLYHARFRSLVSSFDEPDAAMLAELISWLRLKGQQMKWFDAAIAATAIARGDKLLTLDTDYDRLEERLVLLKPV